MLVKKLIPLVLSKKLRKSKESREKLLRRQTDKHKLRKKNRNSLGNSRKKNSARNRSDLSKKSLRKKD